MTPLKTIYFDCNATTPTFAGAANAAMKAMNELYGNPSSSHLTGLQAKAILENARRVAAKAVGASQPNEIIFTSGATEAIQMAIFSALHTHKSGKILYGATEHKAVPQALEHWVRELGSACEIVKVPVDREGILNLDFIEKNIQQTVFICTMAVNNETGTVQNLAGIEKLIRTEDARRGNASLLWLVDCVQALGKTALNLDTSRIDYAPFSGHKLYAPKGIGFLYARASRVVQPIIVGGGQERGLRSGTENLPGVAAFGAVLEQLALPEGKSVFSSHDVLVKYRDDVVKALRDAFPKVVFNSSQRVAVPTTVNFSVPGLSSKEMIDLFDSAGIRLSAGSACSSHKVTSSYVLDAMGFVGSEEWRSTSAIRLSFGPLTSAEEIKQGCAAIRNVAMALQGSCLLENNSIDPSDEGAKAALRNGIVQFRAGPTNSWVYVDQTSRNCVVIDPSEPVAERIEYFIRCQKLNIIGIMDTHSHADHETTRPVLESLLADQMVKGKRNDLGWPLSGTVEVTYKGSKVPALVIAHNGDDSKFLVKVETPGHTLDSCLYLVASGSDQTLMIKKIHFGFCGDTILSGGLGRTNFVISDTGKLFDSLKVMRPWLEASTILCPAHDYGNTFGTTFAAEKNENALLTEPDLGKFVTTKNKLDEQLAGLEQSFQGTICGVTSIAYKPTDVIKKTELGTGCDLLVDVREPHEFEVTMKDAELSALSPVNVPLSRVVNFMQTLLEDEKNFDKKLVFICRSGNRSLQAAKAFQRVGFVNAKSLEGGLLSFTV